jgi:hypothetical protein
VGTLVVKAYPTTLFAKAADHTYVECGTGGRGWSCWGGKTGGASVRQANGSTRRADDIAEPNERAGITCYLINGVCHQAANRILLPARITVNGVRGYELSDALFSVYGRTALWPCRAPFNEHPATTGDLPECVEPAPDDASRMRSDLDEEDARYLEGVLAIYQQFEVAFVAEPPQSVREDLHLQLFGHRVDFYLGSLPGDRRQELMEVRWATEQRQQKAERIATPEERPHPELVQEVNDLTLEFQANLAEVTTDDEYEQLLQLRKDEQIVLADPAVTGDVDG